MEHQNTKLGPASDFFTTDPTKCVRIFSTNRDEKFLTIPEIFAEIVDRYPDRPALMQKDENTGDWSCITYREYKKLVEQMTKVFLSLGLDRKGRVAILAFNSAEWLVSALAAIHTGGQFVGIYNTCSSEAVHYILKKSRANIVVVDDDAQLEKVIDHKNDLPYLKAVIQTRPTTSRERIYKWKDLVEMNVMDYEEVYQRNLKEITANSCCSIVYTSGTTGHPKGALLSHDNFIFPIKEIIKKLNIEQSPQLETVVSFLSLSHTGGILEDVFGSMFIGATVFFVDKNALKGTLLNTLLDVQPTIFFSVPRVFEKFYEKIQQEIGKTYGIKKMLFTQAQKSALDYHQKRINGNPSRFSLSYYFFKSLILNKLKAKIGLDRVRFCMCSTAPLNIDVYNFFLSLDIPIYDAYGMTENVVVSINNLEDTKPGSIGKPIPGIEVRISEDGEIQTRGRNTFMGYMDDIEKTRETFSKDNWMKTGDLGRIDEDGYLFVTGRIKELIITADGENIPFLLIENAVKAGCEAISNVQLIGDKRKFLSILITLKTKFNENGAPLDELAPETLKVMKNLKLNYKTLSEILECGPDQIIIDYIQQVISRVNSKAAFNAQKIHKFIILPNDFSYPTGELGPSLKLKRSFVIEKYIKEIDKLYK